MGNRTSAIKLGFLLSLLQLLAVACEEERGEMRYDKGITKIYSSDQDIHDSVFNHVPQLPNELILPFLADNKIASAKIPSVWYQVADNYIYGQRQIFDDTVIVYSNEKEGGIRGFLLLIKEGKIHQWLEIYDSTTIGPKSLNSYLFNNYLIMVFAYDPGYDTIVEGEEDTAEYSFVVAEITQEGTMRFIEEIAGREVAKKYLSGYQRYRGRF